MKHPSTPDFNQVVSYPNPEVLGATSFNTEGITDHRLNPKVWTHLYLILIIMSPILYRAHYV